MQYLTAPRRIFIILLVSLLATAQTASARPLIGLALGGGAARGISHIGLLKAFEEEGIPIDLIVGSSMGSIIAGLYASGLSIDNLTYMVSNINVTTLFDPMFMRGGLLSTTRFHHFLDEITKGADIADLPIPFCTVLTNLDTGEEYTLSHGPLSRAIQASMSMPVVFPPIEIDGDFYVDGGTKNLVPANTVRDMGADVVIAVDIKKTVPIPSHEDLLTNIRLFMQFMFRGYTDKKLPYADYLILPDVSSDSYMDYNNVAYFIEQGYKGAKKALPMIKAMILEKDPTFSFDERRPMPGLSADEFSKLFWQAKNTAYASTSGMTLQLKGFKIPGPQYDISVAYTWPTRPTLFTQYSLHKSTDANYQAVELGLGYVKGNLLSTFLRRYSKDPVWHPGVRLQWRITDTMQFNATWVKQSSLPNEWSASLKTSFTKDLAKVGGSLQLQIGQQGYLDVHPELRIPLSKNSFDVWEVATVYPSLIIGGNIRKHLGNNAEQPSWRAETGLAAQVRVFGIHALHSRLVFAYNSTGKSKYWSWGLAFGE